MPANGRRDLVRRLKFNSPQILLLCRLFSSSVEWQSPNYVFFFSSLEYHRPYGASHQDRFEGFVQRPRLAVIHSFYCVHALQRITMQHPSDNVMHANPAFHASGSCLLTSKSVTRLKVVVELVYCIYVHCVPAGDRLAMNIHAIGHSHASRSILAHGTLKKKSHTTCCPQ